MTSLQNTAEGGSDGTTVTTGNSGGGSGNAWTSIGGTAPVYSVTQVHDGSLAYKFSAATTFNGFLKWSITESVGASVYLRAYFYFAGATIPTTTIFQFGVGASTAEAQLDIVSAGTLRSFNGSAFGAGTHTLAVNTWYRIEFKVFTSTTVGFAEHRLYDNSGTLLEDVSTSAGGNTWGAGTTPWVTMGADSAMAANTFYMDSIGCSDSTWLGAFVSAVNVNAGAATGTGTAQTPGMGLTPGLPAGTGTAQAPDADNQSIASLAAGTGIAQTPGMGLTPGLPAGTGTAQAPVSALTTAAGVAAGTGTAQAPVSALVGNAGAATGTGIAQALLSSITTTAGVATGTGTTGNATAQTGTFAPASLATGTGTTGNVLITITVNPGIATGTGTILSPDADNQSTAGLATGTGISPDATALLSHNVNVQAGLATARSTAWFVATFSKGTAVSGPVTTTTVSTAAVTNPASSAAKVGKTASSMATVS